MSLQWPILILLVPVALGAVLVWRRRPGPGVLTRAILLSLLLLAAAEPAIERSVGGETVVFLLDVSPSIPPAEQARALAEARSAREALSTEDAAILISFSTAPTIEALPGQDWPESLAAAGQRTDLRAALDAALALIPRQEGGRVVLLTDGHTDTEPAEPLSRLADRGIGLTTHTLRPDAASAAVTAITLDTETPAPGETLTGRVTLHGGRAGWQGHIALSAAGIDLTGLDAAADAGQSVVVPLTLSLPPELPAGPTTLRAVVDGVVTEAGFTPAPAPRIWIVSARPQAGAHLAALLTAEGLTPTALAPQDLPGDLTADLVVLADAPADTLPDGFDAALDRFVRDGGSLLTLGGDASYDLGGWHSRPLADLLPVRMDPDGALKDDAVTLVIVLDKSGSMAQSATRSTSESELVQAVGDRLVGGRPSGSKIRLAAEGAVSALGLLRDTDRIGVLTVDTRSRWAVGVQGVTERAAITRRIRSISSGGGGIYTLTALLAAREALRASDTPLRHLILFADTADAGEQQRGDQTAVGVVSELARDGITLSVIGIGSRTAQDAAFLVDLARRGGGRFHATDDPEKLPALFAQETEELLGASIEESPDLRVAPGQWHPALTDIRWEEAPALRGVNTVLEEPAAATLLTTAGGAPLLSTWRVGLGEVASITTDDGGRWSAPWRGWEGGDRLWIQLVRALLDKGTSDTTLHVDPLGTVTVTRYGPDGLSLPRPAVFAGQDGPPEPLPLAATSPGTWTGRLPSDGPPWRLAALDGDGAPLAALRWAPPPSIEHTHRAPDEDRLASLSLPAGSTGAVRTVTMPVWPWLLLIAALLLPVDAFARRRQWWGKDDPKL